MFYIYRHIRPDTNEVFYIGKGLEDSNRHLSKSGRNKYWHNIVNKNEGQYEVEIMMDGLSVSEVIEKEIEFIKLYGRFQDGGTLCNISLGGENSAFGMKHSEETKKRMSNSHKERQFSEEHLSKLSINMNNINDNRVYTPELRAKLASNGFRGKTHTQETKDFIRNKFKGVPKTYSCGVPPKRCIGINISTGEEKEFNSYREAEDYTTVNHNHIRKLIKGIGKQCKNWKFHSL